MAGALSGGEKLKAYLDTISNRLAAAGGQPSVQVGFLEASTYPDGTSLPMVAAIQEFGGTINRPPGQVTVFRKTSASGTHFLRNGRFVKRREANFSTTHATPAYSITIPPRPYFRNMIKQNGPSWPKAIGVLLKNNDFDAKKALSLMGDLIKGQLQASILSNTPPPNAPSTIARKGHSRTLIDSGHMLNSIDYHVTIDSGSSQVSAARSPGSFGGIAALRGGNIGSRGSKGFV
jgi:hypothetical protein